MNYISKGHVLHRHLLHYSIGSSLAAVAGQTITLPLAVRKKSGENSLV